MPYDETLAVKIRQLLGKRKNLVEKQMFGGVGFLLAGNVCCGAWKEFLVLRLGDDAARQVLGEEHTRPFDITGKPMRGWVMVEPAGWKMPNCGGGSVGQWSLQVSYRRSRLSAVGRSVVRYVFGVAADANFSLLGDFETWLGSSNEPWKSLPGLPWSRPGSPPA